MRRETATTGCSANSGEALINEDFCSVARKAGSGGAGCIKTYMRFTQDEPDAAREQKDH